MCVLYLHDTIQSRVYGNVFVHSDSIHSHTISSHSVPLPCCMVDRHITNLLTTYVKDEACENCYARAMQIQFCADVNKTRYARTYICQEVCTIMSLAPHCGK